MTDPYRTPADPEEDPEVKKPSQWKRRLLDMCFYGAPTVAFILLVAAATYFDGYSSTLRNICMAALLPCILWGVVVVFGNEDAKRAFVRWWRGSDG